MKKIINGKVYDTRTAQLVGCIEHGSIIENNLDYVEENLLRKRTGEFFLYRSGGPRTDCCDGVIEPMTYEEARRWAEGLDGDDYIKIFGDPGEGEGDEKRQVTLYLTDATIAKIKRAAAQGGQSMSGWIEAAVDAALAAG